MNPDILDIKNQIGQINEAVKKLTDRLNALGNKTTIPNDIDNALTARLFPNGLVLADNTADSPDTISIPVGMSTFIAAAPMTGFILIEFNGITYKVPYY